MYLERDSDGHIGIFSVYQSGYSPASQDKIDAYVFREAKAQKKKDLNAKLQAFRAKGFLYNTWTFNLSEKSALYAKSKRDNELGGVDKYHFYDTSYVKRDFTNAVGFGSYVLAIEEEEERLMEKLNEYLGRIKSAADIAALDAIIITFNA